MADTTLGSSGTSGASGDGSPTSAPQQNAPQVSYDPDHSPASYSNFARVTGSPEELILDFGLNPQPCGGQSDAVPISQRIVLNYFTAKRLLGDAFYMAVQRHEQTFGVLETDVNKRVLPSAQRGAQS